MDEVWPPYGDITSITNTVALTQRGDFIDEDDATNDVIQPDLASPRTARRPRAAPWPAGEPSPTR